MFVMSVAERCQQASVFVYRCVLCDSGVYVRVMAPPIWPAQHTQEERESVRERERERAENFSWSAHGCSLNLKCLPWSTRTLYRPSALLMTAL